ncbi:MAG: tyrosine--tRNA ligase [Oscillospiraceae bacterium]|jgi:tyrosyl-tRNA synthetase|nr:tyrosine--tRNA ligase [Oscillospiraceae bacterium]
MERNVFQELRARNLLAQCTDPEKVEALLAGEPIRFYIGFDPTADSLHIGHFVQAIVMSHMQRAGHIPIALFGGATAMIGDPTGKTEMRRMMTREEIDHNISCFRQQMSAMVDFSEGKAVMVNNADWLLGLNYVEFLREVGVHFSVNRMLAAECYKSRLETGLSFFEMNYMIMQSYDFLHLRRTQGAVLEMGGDDQWSNMIGGVELCRRAAGKEVYAMTSNLLLTSEGKKMGKTEKGAVWLGSDRTSPYEFYQYWRNVADADVINCMKMLTFLPLEEIAEYAALTDSAVNAAKERLAFEVTRLIHGEAEATKAQEAARALFSGAAESENIPTVTLAEDAFTDGGIDVVSALVQSGLAKSRGEARRLVDQGGVFVDDAKAGGIGFTIARAALPVLLRKGKKGYCKLTAADSAE